jgi:hypothetical protein
VINFCDTSGEKACKCKKTQPRLVYSAEMQDTEGRRILLLALFLVTVSSDSLRHRRGGRSRRGRGRVIAIHVGKEARNHMLADKTLVDKNNKTYLNALE